MQTQNVTPIEQCWYLLNFANNSAKITHFLFFLRFFCSFFSIAAIESTYK